MDLTQERVYKVLEKGQSGPSASLFKTNVVFMVSKGFSVRAVEQNNAISLCLSFMVMMWLAKKWIMHTFPLKYSESYANI